MKAPVRTALALVGRTAWAAVVLALSAAVVVAAARLPGEATEPVAPLQAVAPPVASVLTCPGPLRLATEQEGTDATYDPAFDPSPADATSDLVVVTAAPGDEAAEADQPSGAAAAVVTPMAGGAPVGELAAGVEAGVLTLPGADAGRAVHADPVGEVPPWASAGVTWRAGTGDLRGLAAASCRRPSATTWLVGGSTVLGSSARLVLQNPGATPATVGLRMWGSRGPVELAGAPDYLVGPGEEETILLEGLAAEQSQVVVEVTATGGLVSAYLQDSRTDGLTPAGVDLVVSGAEPATDLMVPAISVTEDDPEAAVLRLLAPGAQADPADAAGDAADDEGPQRGTAHVALFGPDGVVELPGTEDISLDVGDVIDVPLDGLEPGDYTAWVTADVPVVAGATVTRPGAAQGGGDAAVERAWSPALVGGVSGPLAVPGNEPGRLVLGAAPADGVSGSARAEVLALDAAGAVLVRRDVTVPVSGTVSLDLAGLVQAPADDDEAPERATAVVVRTDDPRIAWGVVLETPGAVAVLAPVPQQSARPGVAVTLR